MNKPFLKWAGNKYKILNYILPLIGSPKQFIEPFFGSMAVALNVSSDFYVLNDFNGDLVNLHRFVLYDKNFIEDCQEIFKETNNSDAYYSIRDNYNNTSDEREKAIFFLYLNRHCFNGLVRYNSKGKFNVPFGKYKSPYFPKKELINYKKYFSNKSSVRVTCYDFLDERLYFNINSDTVVYFDPPYLPLSSTSSFNNYTGNSFSYENHKSLRDLAIELNKNGAKVIISNHDIPETRELYSNASIISLNVNRTIAANKSSRKSVKEILAVWS